MDDKSELWDGVQFLRRSTDPGPYSAERKIEILAQMVMNLVDEVEILKRRVGKMWRSDESYRHDKM